MIVGVLCLLVTILVVVEVLENDYIEQFPLLSIVMIAHNVIIAGAAIVFGVLTFRKKENIFAIVIAAILVYLFFGANVINIGVGGNWGNLWVVAYVLSIIMSMATVAALTLLICYFFMSRSNKIPATPSENM